MGIGTSILALTTASVLAAGSVAYADNIQDSIEDNQAPVTLVAGSSTTGSAAIRLNQNGGDGDTGCNIDPGEDPLKLTVVTPSGVTANPNPLSITSCNTDFTVQFTASSTAVSGNATVEILSTPAGGGGYTNHVSIPITVTQPAPTNTKPTVAVTGVTHGAVYEIGSVPVAGCSVTDAEDTNPTASPVITGTLVHGLGTLTATCDYTDTGKLGADTATATYTVADTGNPTITASLTPSSPGLNGWYTSDVVVDFTCADSGSGIASCTNDAAATEDVTFGEGKNQSVTGTATDHAGNTATTTVSNINVDKTAPTDIVVAGVSDRFFQDPVSAASCTATDGVSGVASCEVTGHDKTAVGSYTAIATATNGAGLVSTKEISYQVKKWTATGFYSPVDMGTAVNTVKGGSTVPLKFEAFAAAELTSTSIVKSFASKLVACGTLTGTADEVELTTTGKTELRYDTVSGQFVQNWQTPKVPGNCYVVTLTLQDGTTVAANFKLK